VGFEGRLGSSVGVVCWGERGVCWVGLSGDYFG
jgi:hypothetical protein